MQRSKFMQPVCVKCSNADGTATFSNWHYCTNPENTREFTTLRHRSDFDGSEIRNTPPAWCPNR
jgi:hypothetical protein